MSLFPIEVVDTYRQHINTVIDIYGIDADLYTPKEESVQQREALDIYEEKPNISDHSMTPLKTKVFIEWKPDIKRLRRLGIFTEDSIPIIAWFKSDISELTRNAYIRMAINYRVGDWGTDEFELVDCLTKSMYNAIVIQAWVISPRRK